MKNKNRNVECGPMHITTDASGKYVLLAEIDPYSRMIMNYEIRKRPVEKIQKNQREIAIRKQLACRLPQRSPGADASRGMNPLTLKEFEELVNNAISRGNKCDS